jgi:hypothetical protein
MWKLSKVITVLDGLVSPKKVIVLTLFFLRYPRFHPNWVTTSTPDEGAKKTRLKTGEGLLY